MRMPVCLLLCVLALGAQSVDLAESLQREAVAFAEAQAAGRSISIRTLRPPILPKLQEGTVRFEPAHISKQELTGVFFVAFRFFVNDRPAGTTRVDLEGRWTGTLLRTRTALPRKSVPTDEQLEAIPFEGVPPPGAITEYPAGYQLKIPVGAGKFLCRADLQPIPVINIGDPVRLELVCGSLVIVSGSVARTSGVLGDKIRLELPNSRRFIQAVIVGPGEARIQWMQPGG